MSQIFVRFGCKTIDFAVLDVLSGCRFDVFDCSVRILVGKLAVFVNREVFVDGCVEFAQRNRDCKVALFEVCALACAFVFDKRVACRNVVVGVAVPCGICIRNESVIIGGHKHECLVIVCVTADSVVAVAVFRERRARPCAIPSIEVCDGFIHKRTDFETEIYVDAGRVAIEVDCHAAGVFGVGCAQLGQELSHFLQDLAVAVGKHTDEVCDESFIETDGDEVVCDEQSAKHDIENAPDVCGNHARVDFLVCRHCRNGRLCGSGRRTRTENA